MFRRSAAYVSITAGYPRLTPWATDLPPLRGYRGKFAKISLNPQKFFPPLMEFGSERRIPL